MIDCADSGSKWAGNQNNLALFVDSGKKQWRVVSSIFI